MGKLFQAVRKLRGQDDRGQASLLVGAMLLTFSLFFAFVINTGMLVHAKINLQNAADVAAYAGAATQARQLTQISYLNYEMRRQWKKFLFRYYVLGNFGQETHPQIPRPATRVWAPKRNSPKPFGVPAICVNFDSRENVCQNASVPPIPIPRSPKDAITEALAIQLQRLELLRQGGCVSIGIVNTLLRQLWLMNTDPDLEEVLKQLNSMQSNDPNAGQMIATATRAVRSMAAGLGILPRLMLLRKRIDTLEKYVNHRSYRGMNFTRANELKAASGQPGPDWAPLERSVQAYFSAYNTLGTHSFDNPDEIILDELLPEGGDGSNLLALDDITTEFGVYSIDMMVGADADCGNLNQANLDNGKGKACTQCLSAINFSQGAGTFEPVVGVAKDPSVMTYYAVRLSAKAKLLFSPFGGDVTLTAYSAAQPFGSRIGPPKAMTFFSQIGRPPLGANQSCFGSACPQRVPNLPVGENEPNEPTTATGWNSEDILATYFNRIGPQMAGGSTAGVPQRITLNDMYRAYQIAMSPNPWEAGKYNIPNNLAADEHVRTFSHRGVHAIWAPLVPPGSGGNDTSLRDTITQMLQNAARGASDPTSRSAFPPALQQSLINGMEAYINNKLRSQNGEDNEGINVVRLYDPYMTREVDGNGNLLTPRPIEGLPDRIWLNPRDRLKVSTSWNGILDAALQQRGRSGYSVKFIPLGELGSASSLTTDGSTPFTNRLPASDNLGRDLQNLKH